MTAPPAPIALYAAHWKAFLITLFFAGFLFVDWLYYFVWPTPTVTNQPWLYQEPAKTIFFICWGLIGASGFVAGLYWTLTTRPLLHLSSTSLVYRPFPRPTYTISWDDIEHVSAIAPQSPTIGPWTPATSLTLLFTFKPHRPSGYQPQQRLHLDIKMGLLSLPADELLQLIGTYHHVQVLPNPSKSQVARTPDRREHNDHRSSPER